MKLAAPCCRTVSSMRDQDNVSIVRKSMIRCGRELNLKGVWECEQLFPHLQELVHKDKEFFDDKQPIAFCEVVV